MAAQPAPETQPLAAQPAQPIQPRQHAGGSQGSMALKVPLPAPSDWSLDEDTILESALAEFWEAPDRIEKATSRLSLRNIDQVRHRLRLLEDDIANIDAGRIPLPNYASAQEHTSLERRKGIPWTEDEHRLFLMGLAKFGKGDWRSISRNYVISRTPTQVASHAQKYFIRLNSLNKKDKRRSSIHDITSPGGHGGEVTGMVAPVHGAMQQNGVMAGVGPVPNHIGPRPMAIMRPHMQMPRPQQHPGQQQAMMGGHPQGLPQGLPQPMQHHNPALQGQPK